MREELADAKNVEENRLKEIQKLRQDRAELKNEVNELNEKVNLLCFSSVLIVRVRSNLVDALATAAAHPARPRHTHIARVQDA
jgi:uncharacterized protein YlxW (UPF0749 family)